MEIEFERYAALIKQLRDREVPWERIHFLAVASGDDLNDGALQTHLDDFINIQCYPAITCAEWHALVDERKEAEDSGASNDDGGLYVDIEPNNDVLLTRFTSEQRSCWQQYRRKLLEKKFTLDAVERIEEECKWIVNRLRLDTTSQLTAVKGLVVGNVQSGKTANMAGVISMAADIGFNFFVVLAGRVTNLRTQTTDRLIEDVKSEQGIGGLEWRSFVEMLRPSVQTMKLSDFSWTELDNGARNRHRYLTVCLKEPNWLKNLIRWLQLDSTNSWINTSHVKMLIIDDECDQASVNTQDVETERQTTIFKCILGLCNHSAIQRDKGRQLVLGEGHPYAAVNYLGYTATPYANLLNDADPKKSLYPRDFIKPLKASPSYWGPNQIFGILDPETESEFANRPFLCEVPQTDLEAIRDIHQRLSFEAPETLKAAIKWFICASAVQRRNGETSPVSMLIHTSNSVSDHDAIANSVAKYLCELRALLNAPGGKESLIDDFSSLYAKQRDQLPLDEFNDRFLEYQPKQGEIVRDYPEFGEIESHILAIVRKEPERIQIVQDEGSGQKRYEYSDAIHLCVDNSDSKANRDEDTGNISTLRVRYPSKEDQPLQLAPLFIVVGGNTLARGLTLEGLVSSYFLRTVRTCDSLMQMGRWFGYRFGYELLPRIWMTKECVVKFAHLTQADLDLRQRLEEAVALNKKPEEFAPCMIDTSKAIKGFTVTSKNKMQMSEVAEADYSCQTKMPYLFSTDNADLLANAAAVDAVLSAAGCMVRSVNVGGNYFYKEGVQYGDVEEFLKAYRFCPRTQDFSDKDALLKYLSERLSSRPWTVVASGELKEGKFAIQARNYSNKKDHPCPAGAIAFRHVTEPSDFIADIDPKLDFPQNQPRPKQTQSKKYRCAATVRKKNETPILVLTRFDAQNINDINNGAFSLENDIYGFALFLPSIGDGEMKSYTKIRCSNLSAEPEPESEV